MAAGRETGRIDIMMRIGRLPAHLAGNVLLGAAFMAAALGSATPADAQTEIKIGVISTMSGPDAQPGEQMNNGIKLYVKEHEKDLPPGVKVTMVYRDDTGANPDVA